MITQQYEAHKMSEYDKEMINYRIGCSQEEVVGGVAEIVAALHCRSPADEAGDIRNAIQNGGYIRRPAIPGPVITLRPSEEGSSGFLLTLEYEGNGTGAQNFEMAKQLVNTHLGEYLCRMCPDSL